MLSPSGSDLVDISLFAGLDDLQRTIVANWLEVQEVEPPRRLTHQGAAGYAFFILRNGSADVIVDGEVVRTLGEGDFFGEISLIDDGRQTATVTITERSVVWTMFGTRFRELQQQHPSIAAAIDETARARIASDH